MIIDQKKESSLLETINNTPLITLVWLKTAQQTQDARQIVRKMLGLSCGPYGTTAVEGGDNRLAWALLLPDKFSPLTCWSIYNNDKEVCLIEGEMYDDLPDLKIHSGENQDLAKHIAFHMREQPSSGINDLNGVYSAVYVNSDRSCAYIFGDHSGTRPIFWISNEQFFAVTNNLWAFRGFDLLKKRIDPMTLTQMLTIGFPMAGRTWLLDVKQLQRGRLLSSHENGPTDITMLLEPMERQSCSFRKSIAILRENMDDTLKRLHLRAGGNIGLGLSGGLDSRLCLASLASQHLKHNNFTFCFHPSETDNRIAELASKKCNEDHITILLDSSLALSLYRDMRIINEGESPGFGFFLFAASVKNYATALIIGSEAIRDTPLGPFWPWAIKTKQELASHMLSAQMDKFTPKNVMHILDPSLSISWKDVLAEWNASFHQINHNAIMEVYWDHQLDYRVQRRARIRLDASRWFCQPVYPYMDKKLYTAFRTIPMEHLKGERAHLSLLSNYNKGLENLPNAARWITRVPISQEYRYHHIFHAGRVLRSNIALPLFSKLQMLKGHLGLRQNGSIPLLNEETIHLKKCGLFNWKEVQSIIEKAEQGKFVNRNALHSLINTVIVHDFLFGSGLRDERSLRFLQPVRKIHFNQ
jgi:hypothetical protein